MDTLVTRTLTRIDALRKMHAVRARASDLSHLASPTCPVCEGKGMAARYVGHATYVMQPCLCTMLHR